VMLYDAASLGAAGRLPFPQRRPAPPGPGPRRLPPGPDQRGLHRPTLQPLDSRVHRHDVTHRWFQQETICGLRRLPPAAWSSRLRSSG
jgi:hypothetical protein